MSLAAGRGGVVKGSGRVYFECIAWSGAWSSDCCRFCEEGFRILKMSGKAQAFEIPVLG